MTHTNNRRKCKEYHLRRHQMGGSTLVDATESAATLTELAERMSLSAIGRAIGSSHSYVSRIIRGEINRIAPDKAANIRAIARYRPDDTSHVKATSARRRIRSLHALGYSWALLSRELPRYSLTSIKNLAHDQFPVIEARHDQSIRDAYDRLSMTLPASTDQYERSGIGRARNNARRRGWAPPLAWNNIDDPDETPTDWEYKRTYENREAVLRELIDRGANIHQACRDLHTSRDTLETWCRRNNQTDLYRTLTERAITNENQYATEAAA